jgi:hypothetical protein
MLFCRPRNVAADLGDYWGPECDVWYEMTVHDIDEQPVTSRSQYSFIRANWELLQCFTSSLLSKHADSRTHETSNIENSIPRIRKLTSRHHS